MITLCCLMKLLGNLIIRYISRVQILHIRKIMCHICSVCLSSSREIVLPYLDQKVTVRIFIFIFLKSPYSKHLLKQS